ncbi:MAG TPA: nuclear transport factor 2 family protein [Pyrinomonadaceae bacterium]
MRRMLIVLALLAIISSLVPGQNSVQKTDQSNNAEQAVLKTIEEWFEAEGRHDRAALARIVADDFIGTGPMGNTLIKQDVLPREGARAGGLSVTGRDISVRVYG